MGMAIYLARRFVTMAVTLLIISALVFLIIKLPPGDFLTNQIDELRAQGDAAATAKAEFLRTQYGLDRPVWEQYLTWIGLWRGPNGFSGLLQGDWGWSFEFQRPVKEVVGNALFLTLLVKLAVVVFIHIVAKRRRRYTAIAITASPPARIRRCGRCPSARSAPTRRAPWAARCAASS